MTRTRWIAIGLLATSTMALAGDRPGRRASHGVHAGRGIGGGRYWVPAEYTHEEREVVIPAEYRTVERREWVEPVYEMRVRKVWVEDQRCAQPLGIRIGRVKIALGHPGRGGHYETVRERVCVQPGGGFYRTVQQRVCVAPQRVEIVRQKVLVHDGYWSTVPVGRGSPRCDSGGSFRGPWYH